MTTRKHPSDQTFWFVWFRTHKNLKWRIKKNLKKQDTKYIIHCRHFIAYIKVKHHIDEKSICYIFKLNDQRLYHLFEKSWKESCFFSAVWKKCSLMIACHLSNLSNDWNKIKRILFTILKCDFRFKWMLWLWLDVFFGWFRIRCNDLNWLNRLWIPIWHRYKWICIYFRRKHKILASVTEWIISNAVFFILAAFLSFPFISQDDSFSLQWLFLEQFHHWLSDIISIFTSEIH